MRTITTAELEELHERNPGLPIINTLPREAFEQTRIPGAINIPQNEPDFVDRVKQEAGKQNEMMVVYCASSQCDSSEKATKKLEEAGFTSVLTYKGGAQAWKNEAKESSVAAT
jgi:rhodanese-related sulfurtransferase